MTAKIVYYGPAVCGKTTSLQVIHQKIAPNQRGKLLSLATETDRTIFFDLLPLKLGEIKGFKLKFQLYTVPGQVKYNNTRKVVLQGADAIVFVADSQRTRRQANIESFKNLQENLLEQRKRLEDMPLVYEYNKRDVDSLLTIEELNRDLNPRGLPYFETIASQGRGVMEALEAISKLTLEYLERQLGQEQKPKSRDIIVPKMEKDKGLRQEEETGKVAISAPPEILDLTLEAPSEETLPSIPDDDLANLFESEAVGSLDQPDASPPFPTPEEDLLAASTPSETEEDLLSPSKPIGYGENIQIQEAELAALQLEDEGTNLQSQFFDLKEVEAQAFRDLENFLGPLKDEESSISEVSVPEASEELGTSLSPDEELLDFKLEPGYEEPQEESSSTALFDAGEDLLSLTSETGEKAPPEDLLIFPPEKEEQAVPEDLLDFPPEEEKASGTLSEPQNLEEAAALMKLPAEESAAEDLAEALLAPEVTDLGEPPLGSLEGSRSTPLPEAPLISEDPFGGLMGFSKYLCQKAQEHLTKGTNLDNSLAILLYYFAVETALKAVALKFETCNPEIAAMPIVLDSIEEETGKSIGGRKFLEERIIKTKNDVQLRLLSPDAETCQLVSRTAERFLETLSQDFLNVDFSRLPPSPLKPSEELS